MNKYLLLLGATALLAAGCSVGDPENPWPEDQSVLFTNGETVIINGDDAGDDAETINPLSIARLTDVGNTHFEYASIGYLTYITTYRYYDGANLRLNFSYDAGSHELPTSISWYGDGYENAYSEEYNYTVEIYVEINHSLKDIAWNADNTMASATYTVRKTGTDYYYQAVVDKTETMQISFTYTDGHLTVIDIDGTKYNQTWKDGDLITSNNPVLGVSNFTYYDVENIYGQWDPMLPFMGPMQYFNWFGKAPKHWVKGVTSYYEPGNNTEAQSKDFTLNYSIRGYQSYRYDNTGGLIEARTISSSYSYDNTETFTYRVDQ